MGSNPTPSAKTIEIIEEFIIYSGYPQSDAQWIRAPALDTINVIDVIIVIAVLVIFLIAAMFQKRKQRKGPP